MVHKDSAGKTIRKTVKIHRLKRDANKHAKAKKGRKASRKASRKRKSAKRKASRKRKSAKRKSRKRKSAKRKSRKRKASRKRRSAKRKSAKRKSRKRKSAKRKSRKRKSAKRKSRKRNFGFFTQRMRDSMRRKYQRTKDSFGRTFSKNYISKHEFLPPRKLPANLYPLFIQKFPRFRGRNPSSNPIIFKAKPGETASTFKNRVDRLFKNYRQAFYKKEYILARQGGYDGSMKDHIEEKAQKREELQERKQCEFIQKQIQRAPKGPRRAALKKDFETRCA
ncbi:hypothetical protein DRH13_03505, partial [Candidatus Woesebacteria bacterium]